MNYSSAIQQALENKVGRHFPNGADARSRDGILFPAHKPKFHVPFSPDQTIFTIGSCFARNIEEALAERNVFFPTGAFRAPKSEWKGVRPNGLLNEYNPGTISQRILFALQGRDFPEATIVPSGELYADLLLPGALDVTLERAHERRAEISAIYRHLAKSDLAIITLGYVEAWYDKKTDLFLNRAPPKTFAKKFPGRFEFRVLDVFDCLPLLEKAISALESTGIKTIITVSPVPLQTTFTTKDCIIANEFSKSVLRVCAERLERHALVDYFPSYEIVRSSGVSNFDADQVHVKDEVVRSVIKYMVSLYEKP